MTEADEDQSEPKQPKRVKEPGENGNGKDKGNGEGQEIETRHRQHRSTERRDRPRVRPSENKGPDTTATLNPLTEADPKDWLGSNQDPDVLLSIPNLGVDRIYLNVDNVRAHVELHAKVLDLLELHVGADASIDKVELEIDNVRVQAMLKVRLDRVVDIVSEVMKLLTEHPEILSNLTRGLGAGLEAKLSEEGGEATSVQEADRMQLQNEQYTPEAGKRRRKQQEPDEDDDEEDQE